MKVVIRADCNTDIGMGHLNRCSLLYDAFISAGIKASFITTRNEHSEQFLSNRSNIIYIEAENEFYPPLTNADLVIVDKYNYTDGYYEEIQAENTIIFDDIEFIVPSRVNGVINLQAYANQSRYSSIKAFCGLEYFPLRPEFCGIARDPNANNIFFVYGRE